MIASKPLTETSIVAEASKCYDILLCKQTAAILRPSLFILYNAHRSTSSGMNQAQVQRTLTCRSSKNMIHGLSIITGIVRWSNCKMICISNEILEKAGCIQARVTHIILSNSRKIHQVWYPILIQDFFSAYTRPFKNYWRPKCSGRNNDKARSPDNGSWLITTPLSVIIFFDVLDAHRTITSENIINAVSTHNLGAALE